MTYLYFKITGKGETITFVHGDTLDHHMWDEQIIYFSKNYQVLTYDMRGYGKSPTPKKPFYHHKDLYDLLKSLNINEAHLVGSSYGGEKALDFAVAYPKSVTSLTLVNSALSGFNSTVNWNVGIGKAPLAKVKQNWLNHPLFSSLSQHPKALEKVINIVSDYRGSRWLHPEYHLSPSVPALKKINTLKIPTLILTGSNDLEYFHQIAKIIQSKIPEATYVNISDHGHLINLENPILFNQLTSDFLNKIPKKP